MKTPSTKNTVCVLMSTYNGEQYIKQQLDSILSQKNVRVYLMIRDDGSADSTPQILKTYEGENVEIIYGENVGVQKSFSQLVSYAQNRTESYYAFADQDDFWNENKLSIACEWLTSQEKEQPLLYFSNLNATDENLNIINKVYPDHYVNINKKSCLIRNYAYGCTMVFNKKAVNLYNTNIEARMWMHDYWMYYICVYLGKVYYDSTPYIAYRQHSGNTVGYRHSLSGWLKRKCKSLTLLSEHPRENMAFDFYDTFKNLLSSEDQNLLMIFFNYRKNLFTRFKAAFHKDYYVCEKTQNLFLFIRFLLGAV